MEDWIDGKPGQAELLRDRGLAYGDGLFETIAVRQGRPRLLSFHLQRLTRGCERLRIPCDIAQVATEIERYSQSLQEGVAKLVITRGDGLRGYAPPAQPQVRRLLLGSPLPVYPTANAQNGIALFACSTRLARQPLLAGLKHLNRLEQVLARAEWSSADYAEGLMLDEQGLVVEGVFSNLFLVREGQLLTPALERCGVAGVMRSLILQRAAHEGLVCEVRDITLDELAKASEVFLCNSQYGIWPAVSYGAWRWSPGPLTRKLQGLINEVLGG